MTIKRFTLFCALLLGAFLMQQHATQATASNDAWIGHYFSNSQLRGAPAVTRSDTHLRFFWGNGKPAPEINSSDYFSARWSRGVTLDQPQLVKFVARGDDGYRLFVDGKLLIDQMSGVPLEKVSAEIPLTSGHHSFYVEYYEHVGNASIDLQYYFEPIRQPVNRPIVSYLGKMTQESSVVTTIPTNDFFIPYGEPHQFPADPDMITIGGVTYEGYAVFEAGGAPIGPNSASRRVDDGIELRDANGNLASRISWNPANKATSPSFDFHRVGNTLYVMKQAFARPGILLESELRAYDVRNPWVPVEIALPASLMTAHLDDFVVNGNVGFALNYSEDNVPSLSAYNLASGTPHEVVAQFAVPDIEHASLPGIRLENNHLFVTDNNRRYSVFVINQP